MGPVLAQVSSLEKQTPESLMQRAAEQARRDLPKSSSEEEVLTRTMLLLGEYQRRLGDDWQVVDSQREKPGPSNPSLDRSELL